MNDERRNHKLSGWAIFAAVTIGLLLMTTVALVYFYPLGATLLVSFKPSLKLPLEAYKATSDLLPRSIAVTVFASGVVCFIYGITGRPWERMRLSPGGGVEIETDTVGKEPLAAEGAFQVLMKRIDERVGNALAQNRSQPAMEPFDDDEGVFRVFPSVATVPISTLKRFLQVLPQSYLEEMKDLSSITRVYRKKGKGSPRWYFQRGDDDNDPLVLISGRGKGDRVR